MPRGSLALFVALLLVAAVMIPTAAVRAGETFNGNYRVLPAITHGNLTIFPVVAASTHDASEFLTLDEGVRSGEVVVTEAGRAQALVRGPHQQTFVGDGARVNQLVLINNSKRPLLLLAGEIVTGGKQDRVIGKDRIVPAGGEPIDLNVFCVEPGRWTAVSDKFRGTGFMVQPSVRAKAMDAKNQQQVWDEVGRSHEQMAQVAAASPAAGSVSLGGLNSTTSYARVMDNAAVKQTVESVAAPIEHDYGTVIRELKQRNAVGVVVAVGGHIIWADLFASADLLEKYWPKLIRSYAAQAVVERTAWSGKLNEAEAQKFLEQMDGTREVVEREPGIYRHAEISGVGYKVFQLTALLPRTGFDLHLAKMVE